MEMRHEGVDSRFGELELVTDAGCGGYTLLVIPESGANVSRENGPRKNAK